MPRQIMFGREKEFGENGCAENGGNHSLRFGSFTKMKIWIFSLAFFLRGRGYFAVCS